MRSLHGQLSFIPLIFLSGFFPLFIGLPYYVSPTVQTIQLLPQMSNVEAPQQQEQPVASEAADGDIVPGSDKDNHGVMYGFGPAWIVTL